jgi:DNA-directed RNA polymerase specialized sigma24 family protein
MLDKLALKHELWLKMAKGICKDVYLADDLVSEMYLKLHNETKELNEFYIYFTIKHLFINHIRNEKKYADEIYIKDGIDIDDNKLMNAEIPNCITWVEKQILLLRQESSGRTIGKKYNIHYTKVHRIEKEAKEKLKKWGEENQKKLQDLGI